MPKISVVMPVYNAEKYLREAMDSILNQTYTDFEFIILDDGSKDSSPDIVRSYSDSRIRFYQNEHNMGVAATLNRGLDLATGEYISRMDSDDISMPERFEKQVQYMDAHPDVAVCGCDIQLFGADNGPHVFSHSHELLKIDLLFNSCLAHPSVMMRSALFGNDGLHYDNTYSKMEDYALWVLTSQKYKLACIPEILLKYRIHPQQVTQQHTNEHSVQDRMLKSIQIESLGLSSADAGFEHFMKCCHTSACDNIQDIVRLSNYCNVICEQNQKSHIYAPIELRNVLNSWLTSRCNRLGIWQGAKAAQKCGLNGVSYAIRRIKHMLVTGIQRTIH